MPGKDGRGSSQGGGSGRGGGQKKGGAGRGGGRGSGGQCICPQCGAVAPHTQGTPCFQMKCPKCSAAMIREGS